MLQIFVHSDIYDIIRTAIIHCLKRILLYCLQAHFLPKMPVLPNMCIMMACVVFLSFLNGIQGINLPIQLKLQWVDSINIEKPNLSSNFCTSFKSFSSIDRVYYLANKYEDELKLFFPFLFHFTLQQFPLPDEDIKEKWESQIVPLLEW